MPGDRSENSKAAKETKTGQQRRSRNSRKSKQDNFPVIGLGASAGGLDAFSKFFSTMPDDTGMAFVLIQHLDPTHTSSMVALLARQTKMPVDEATDGMKLEPNHVYMIPPNKDMTIIDRTLMLGDQPERPGISHNIDLFFRSLADDLREKAVAVILSGTGADGSMGARAIKAELGLVLVQAPEDAGYDGMPRSAITAGVADFVLPAEEMSTSLIEYVKKSYGKRHIRRENISQDARALNTVMSLVRGRTKHDFSGYKQSTINRRIERRMGINQIDDINHYVRYLREHPTEIDFLVKDFLINVTAFFRDPEAFSVLKEEMKKMLTDKAEGCEIRAWVPGCSTGEEAYSIAIIIEEAQAELKKYCKLQVFGTDLDDDAINSARQGIYPPAIAADVTGERLEKFFIRKEDHYQVKTDLREKLVFALQDINSDPPFTKMDVISARNMLIYFESSLQKKLIPMFNYALNEGGLLFLGTAETVGEFTDGFEIINRKWKIYRERSKVKEAVYMIPERTLWSRGAEGLTEAAGTAALTRNPKVPPERMILEALPPSVLIDHEYRVVYAHGETGRYLQLPEGTPNTNLLEMVRGELRSTVTAALHEAITQRQKVVRQRERIKVNDTTISVRLTVTPVFRSYPGGDRELLILTFEEIPRPRRSGKNVTDERIKGLEQELQFTKETLRSTIEELETANEELRSSNEEYQSTNEELQSTNEELETSREELQSLNEELNTVNAEYQKKIEELSTINDDMNNLINSTGIATIFLDEDLTLQRFTPAATNIFNFRQADVGRPLSDITHRIEQAEALPQLARQVLDTLVPIKQSVKTSDGRSYSMRVHPYRTTENSIAGVGISFIDVSEEKQDQE